jgi:hypothetical protein
MAKTLPAAVLGPMMAVMRALLAAFAVTVLAAPGAAAQVPDPPPVTGSWFVDFTVASVRTVGNEIGREGDLECGAERCGSSYRFSKGRAGEKAQLLVRFDGTACHSLPCEIPVTGMETVAYDGTTYRLTGGFFYESARDVAEMLPSDVDSLTFTVGGTDDAPTLSGELTGIFAFVGPTAEDGSHLDVTGYEVYTGPVTGRPVPGNPGFVGGRGPGTSGGGSGGLSGGAPGQAEGGTVVAPEARADDLAARAHTRPVLSTRVATPKQLPWAPSKVAVSAVLALVLVLLMPFPAALFNATLEEHYDEVRGWFRLRPRSDAVASGPAWPRFLLLTGGIAVVGAFLDPGLAFDSASAVLVAGLALAAVTVSLLSAAPGHLYARRRYAEGARLALYPLGLAIAAACVLVSRLTSFEPGYLYGVVAGFGIARELRTDEKGRLSLATSAAMLAVAGVAFGLRLPVHDAVLDGGGWPLVLLDTVLAAVFAAGVEANVLGLLPLRSLPGETVYRWSRVVWGAVFGVNVFVFLHALSAAAGTASSGASVTVAAALFGAFATVSVAFWAWFRFRSPDPVAA